MINPPLKQLNKTPLALYYTYVTLSLNRTMISSVKIFPLCELLHLVRNNQDKIFLRLLH